MKALNIQPIVRLPILAGAPSTKFVQVLLHTDVFAPGFKSAQAIKKSPAPPVQKSKKNNEGIDTIRFIVMCLVVWGHCNLGIAAPGFHSTFETVLQSVILQSGKIGIILFFVISGFLLEPEIKVLTAMGFIKSRFRSTILPWLAFVLLFALLTMFETPDLKLAIANHQFKHLFFIGFGLCKDAIFYFAYWFIVVFLSSAVLLIALKKYINQTWFVVVLIMITACYCINLHYGWISANHTKTFLGFPVFMWIGIQLSRHYQKFRSALNQTSWLILLGCFALTYALACSEGMSLSKAGCSDPYAAIRFTNILNALVVMVGLFKLGRVKWVNLLHPSRTVYGIYLLHSIVVYQLTMIYKHYFQTAEPSALGLLIGEIVVFEFVLITSYLIVDKLIVKYKADKYGKPADGRYNAMI